MTEPIPVAPAAHFACGGVRASLDGVTSVPGLFAIGEVADTGVHGANRLASNGVTEGLVAGRLVADRLSGPIREPAEPVVTTGCLDAVTAAARSGVTSAMSHSVGPLRDREGLAAVAETLSSVAVVDKVVTLADIEATNITTVAQRVVAAALERTESRGSHRRLDHPEPVERWRGRIVQRWDGERARTHFEPVSAS